MPVERDNPESILIREQERTARPRQSLPLRTWPTSGEFVPPPRVTRGALPSSVRTPPRLEPPLRFITSSAAAGAHSAASALAAQGEAKKRPPEPPKPHSPPPHPGKRPSNTLVAKSLKCTVVVSPEDVAAIAVRDGQSRVVLTIRLPDRTLTADISAKSARRAIAAVREHGPEAVAAIVQGKLVGDRIEECGLAVQLKTPKPAAEAAC